ncbi:3-hydroxyisobutyrate dehydrogenase [Azospirillum sp. TSO22-1]|uniref:3-hydroxyisobutyrate dehydrogenase n=1 Tax=Azospirillum sp. TSO22-1 TaxID=716789 RepID=UPI000D60CED1|nr:3-hydroxyisobutyrate dehydrogenase [Azospirillum sp. TSO22-1]PWC52824.1 3-hydroxyisobutyrate dehydrogenase [Azospirillum sp. TSO22-1]
MANVAFIGLGNMGGPMAANLVKAGHRVAGFDMMAENLDKAKAAGVTVAVSAAEAARDAEVVVTMLPAGQHVRDVYTGSGGVMAAVGKGALLIDCSTVDVESARAVAKAADEAGLDMVDAPVSGGVGGATGGTLTFMVGGGDAAFQRAEPILQAMGKTIVHAGASGTGQAAKICNNMILGISMIAVSEAFVLAKSLGLDAQKLFDIASKSSGQCWSMTSYCPVPGPVPTSPANRDYQAGFTAAMMLKDLRLAQQAASQSGAATPLGAEAASLYALFCNGGRSGVDFSGIIKMIAGE